MMEKHTCEKSIWTVFYTSKCGKNAKFERNGKWYCGYHDPVKVKARRDQRDARRRQAAEYRRKLAEDARKEREEREFFTDACIQFTARHAQMGDDEAIAIMAKKPKGD